MARRKRIPASFAKTMARYKPIPEELKAKDKWLVYGGEGMEPKRPYNPVTRRAASTTGHKTWASFEECYEAVKGGTYRGLGFVFTGDYIVIDLDNVVDRNGYILPEAADIIEAVDSYTEVSQSGRGFHIIARHSGLNLVNHEGTLKKCHFSGVGKEPGIEIYDNERYIILTGRVFEGRREIKDAPEALERVYNAFVDKSGNQAQAAAKEAVRTPYSEPQEAVSGDLDRIKERMRKGKNRDRIAKLWSGDTSDYPGVNGGLNEARAALLNDLIFYTDANPVLIDKLYRQSGLYRLDPERWNEKRGSQTFGQYDIGRLINRARENGERDGRPWTYTAYVRWKATGAV
nr:MAG TPA: hypothetical protein [Caudoviricetes sp.]